MGGCGNPRHLIPVIILTGKQLNWLCQVCGLVAGRFGGRNPALQPRLIQRNKLWSSGMSNHQCFIFSFIYFLLPFPLLSGSSTHSAVSSMIYDLKLFPLCCLQLAGTAQFVTLGPVSSMSLTDVGFSKVIDASNLYKCWNGLKSWLSGKTCIPSL